MTPDRAPTIRQMAEQVAGTLAGEVMQDEYDATGQHGGDWTTRFADAIEPVLQAVAAQVERETRDRLREKIKRLPHTYNVNECEAEHAGACSARCMKRRILRLIDGVQVAAAIRASAGQEE